MKVINSSFENFKALTSKIRNLWMAFGCFGKRFSETERICISVENVNVVSCVLKERIGEEIVLGKPKYLTKYSYVVEIFQIAATYWLFANANMALF